MRIARQCKNKKLFYKTTTATISHRTQTNVQQSFSNTACHCELAVQQPFFRKFAVLRQHKGNPFAPIQILTGDTREGCAFRRGRLHNDGRSFQRKSRIERRFESQVAGRSRLLETWSPCSRPFAILPVSAVSDAQKLATGNFLHVRAESLSLPDGTLRVLFSPPLAAFLLFPAGNFSILFVRHKKYDKKALPAGSLPPPAALFLLLPQQVLPPPAASFPAESRLFSC